MTVQQAAFLLLAALTLASALWLVMARKVFRATLAMVMSFFGVAGFYVILGSSFMAGLQVFIYVGGVSVLMVIAIMVTRSLTRQSQRVTREPGKAALAALVCFAGLATAILRTPWPSAPSTLVPADDLTALGLILVAPNGYAVLFEVASLMLFVVLLGSLYIAREK